MIEPPRGPLEGRARRGVAVIAAALLVLGAAGLLYLRPHVGAVTPGGQAPAPVPRTFVQDVALADARHGAVGLLTDSERSVSVFLTADGGRTWHHAPLRPGVLGHVRFFGPDQALLVGLGPQGDRAWVTEDGGRSWAARTLPPAAPQDGLEGLPVFLDATSGWQLNSLGDRFAGLRPVELWRTVDGARSWSRLPAVGLPDAGRKGQPLFLSRDRGVLPVDGGAWPSVLVTGDGGARWAPGALPQPTQSGLRPEADGLLRAGDRLVFWVAASGAGAARAARLLTSASADGGSTWSALAAGPDYGGAPPVATGSGRLLLPLPGGARLALSEDLGRTWRDQDAHLPSGLRLASLTAAPAAPQALFGIAGPAPTRSGPEGRPAVPPAATALLRSEDGGAGWEVVRLPRP